MEKSNIVYDRAKSLPKKDSDNELYLMWKKAGEQERIDFIVILCSLYKKMLCMSMQHLGKCIKSGIN